MSSHIPTEEELYNSSAKVLSAAYEGAKPGIGAKYIYIKFDHVPFIQGDLITYDLRNGMNLHITSISDDLVKCTIHSMDLKNWVPANFLEPGVTFYKIK